MKVRKCDFVEIVFFSDIIFYIKLFVVYYGLPCWLCLY